MLVRLFLSSLSSLALTSVIFGAYSCGANNPSRPDTPTTTENSSTPTASATSPAIETINADQNVGVEAPILPPDRVEPESALAQTSSRTNPGDARPLAPEDLSWVAQHLPEPGRLINADQSFWVNLRELGEVAFVVTETVDDATQALNHLEIYLIAPDSTVIHQMPQNADTGSWILWEVKGISFLELDFDGSEPDVLFIADYITGVGPTGSQPFPVTTVYLNQGDYFVIDQAASRFVSDRGIATLGEAEDILRNELNFLP